MITLSENASDAELIAVADRWASALASGDGDGAFGLLMGEPKWSHQRLIDEIEKRILPGTQVVITSPESAVEDAEFDVSDIAPGPPHFVYRWLPGSPAAFQDPDCIGEVCYEIPISGQWSEAVALFRIRKLGDGTVALALWQLLGDEN